jgi:hypothetical protein
MAEVIKFRVPKKFRNSFVRADHSQRGEVVEFSSRAQ